MKKASGSRRGWEGPDPGSPFPFLGEPAEVFLGLLVQKLKGGSQRPYSPSSSPRTGPCPNNGKASGFEGILPLAVGQRDIPPPTAAGKGGRIGISQFIGEKMKEMAFNDP